MEECLKKMEMVYMNNFPNNYKSCEYIKFSENTENWKNFSPMCPHRKLDQLGKPQCTYYDGSIGVCKPENCPFFLGLEGYPMNTEEREEEEHICITWQMVEVEA